MPIAIDEKISQVECLDKLHSKNLTLERLQLLHYALVYQRANSLYAGWDDSEVAEVVAYLEDLLPEGLRRTPFATSAKSKRVKTRSLPVGVTGPMEDFACSLPYRPYVSNCLSKEGLRIVSRGQADLYRYVQHNPPAKCVWLVLDCDFTGALAKVVAQKLPVPNFVATNPENGHSHLFYRLADPVCVSDAGIRRKPAWLLRRIEHQLRTLIGGDVGYMGFISKNLLNEHWNVECVRQEPWKLLDFQDYLTLPKKLPKRSEVEGFGRNVTLFNSCRQVAYETVLAYRLGGTKEQFYDYMESVVGAKNLGFPVPLYAPEVRSIAKSITNWTWRKYTGRRSSVEFSKLQAKRGTRGGVAKGAAYSDKRVEALELASTGMSQKDIAQTLGVTTRTLRNWALLT